MQKLFLLLCNICLAFEIFAQEVNFSEHIAPIIYNNCTSCHRSGEVAPFALTNYAETKAWAPMIQYVTGIKYMPPWKPDKNYSHFIGEKGLTDAQIDLIKRWVAAGTPQGNASLEPSLPIFPEGSQLGTPDLVLKMEKPYLIDGDNQDDYRVFVLPTNFTENKEIAAVEFRPGNRRAVHHALLGFDIDGTGREFDAQDPEYGYESFGGFLTSVDGVFTSYTPGIQTIFYPKGMGRTLPKGSDILIQIHYAPSSTDEMDQSSVNIFFKKPDDPIQREVQDNVGISPLNLDGSFLSFRIQPGKVQAFHATRKITQDVSVINVYPHCHLLGEDWKIFAVTAQNDTIPIIKIDEWDFNWQGAYTFKNMMKIPKGAIVHCYTTYDNTNANPLNPNVPPKEVIWGERTTDEMLLVGMQYVPYKSGDENLIITDIKEPKIEVAKSQLSSIYPNPAKENITIAFYLTESQAVNFKLFDLNGKLIKNLSHKNFGTGNHQLILEVKSVVAGTYLMQLEGTNFQSSEKLIILPK